MISLGTDPGTANYAYAFVSVKVVNEAIKLRIKSAGQLHWTITNLTDKAQKPPKSKRKKKIPMAEQMILPFHEQLPRFKKDWTEQLDRYKPSIFYAERFQTRGLLGKSIEAISMMNGILASMADDRKMSFAVLTAASWKYHVNQIYSLDDLYKEFELPNHIVDANFIALYGALKHYRIAWSQKIVDSMLDELETLVY